MPILAALSGLPGLHAQSIAPRDRRPVTFNRDVAPILYQHCATCHRPGEAAPFNLLTFDDARQRARLIAAAVSSGVMPPWQPESEDGEFEGDRRLAPREVATLTQWVDDGLIEGDGEAPPPMPMFTPGWQLGTPDLIVAMPEGFTVPADGPDVFRNFVLPIPMSERRFVRALEFRPGNPRVLHHARMLLDDTGEVRLLDRSNDGPGFGGMDVPGARFPDGHFLGWAPGKRPAREAYPWPLEPGNDLVIQMHLKPSGRPELVQASVGLYFTDTPPPTSPVMLRLGAKTIDIPADSADYEVIDRFTLPTDVLALSIYPHAHYLAKEMLVLARRPNGTTEKLLNIPNWNFNWQDEYTYAQPVALTRGTTIEMRYRYDNTAGNPHNPSVPPQRVRFGSGTRDEMGELLVQVLPRSTDAAAALRAQVARKNLLTDVAGEEKRVADVPDDAETRNALGARLRAARSHERGGRAVRSCAAYQSRSRDGALQPRCDCDGAGTYGRRDQSVRACPCCASRLRGSPQQPWCRARGERPSAGGGRRAVAGAGRRRATRVRTTIWAGCCWHAAHVENKPSGVPGRAR
ncbi:MAG: hypothetical protein QM736_18150 [Vicinamibacterales bacterium]